MFKKTASLALVAALLCAICPIGALAQSSSSPETRKATETSDSVPAVKADAGRGGNLKAEILRRVEEARSGKALSVDAWQIQPKQSNSLSKGTKIALVVGAALVVILIIVVVHEKNHLFDNFQLGN